MINSFTLYIITNGQIMKLTGRMRCPVPSEGRPLQLRSCRLSALLRGVSTDSVFTIDALELGGLQLQPLSSSRPEAAITKKDTRVSSTMSLSGSLESSASQFASHASASISSLFDPAASSPLIFPSLSSASTPSASSSTSIRLLPPPSLSSVKCASQFGKRSGSPSSP